MIAFAILIMLSGTATPAWQAGSTTLIERTASRTLDGQELLKIGDIHEVQTHLQEALPYYQQALEAFRVKKQRRGEAMALVKIGRLLERQGKPEEALTVLTSAVSLWRLLGDDLDGGLALIDLGKVAEALGRMKEAEQAYHASISLLRKAKERAGRIDSEIRLGQLKIKQDSVTEGLDLLQAALKEARDLHHVGHQMMALIMIGDAERSAGQLDAAKTRYEEGLKIAEANKGNTIEADLFARLAQVHEAAERSADAHAMAHRALALYQSHRNSLREADMLSLLGNLYGIQGDTRLAAEHHEKALTIYRALRNRMRQAGSLANLSIVYEVQGAAEQARDTQEKVVSLLQPAS